MRVLINAGCDVNIAGQMMVQRRDIRFRYVGPPLSTIGAKSEKSFSDPQFLK